MRKYLIINADDFGMCHSANMAVLDLFQSGCIHSTTLMACCPWAKEAVALCHQHPEIHVGLHVAHTAEWENYRWGPMSSQVLPCGMRKVISFTALRTCCIRPIQRI